MSCRQQITDVGLATAHSSATIYTQAATAVCLDGSPTPPTHLQHGLRLIKQLLGLGAHRVVVEDLGVAAVGVAPAQLPNLEDSSRAQAGGNIWFREALAAAPALQNQATK